jgi:hypothetical protein
MVLRDRRHQCRHDHNPAVALCAAGQENSCVKLIAISQAIVVMKLLLDSMLTKHG